MHRGISCYAAFYYSVTQHIYSASSLGRPCTLCLLNIVCVICCKMVTMHALVIQFGNDVTSFLFVCADFGE